MFSARAVIAWENNKHIIAANKILLIFRFRVWVKYGTNIRIWLLALNSSFAGSYRKRSLFFVQSFSLFDSLERFLQTNAQALETINKTAF
ncbi:MAG: hypothetical protein EA361_01220 [Bacteroidetes bacterium]|nr:MAG: hypothetical protein EA361_01220 [Bacteroidota bacterium]